MKPEDIAARILPDTECHCRAAGGGKDQVKFHEGEYVIASRHRALMRVVKLLPEAGKVRLQCLNAGTIDVWYQNIRRPQRGDLLTFGKMKTVYEYLGKRLSDGWYLVAKPGDTGICFHLDSAYYVEIVDARP